MVFEINPTIGFDYLQSFANHLGINFCDEYLQLPNTLGSGFIKQIVFDSHFKILIHKYEIKEELTIRRLASDSSNDILTFRFISRVSFGKNYLSNVQVLNSYIALDDTIIAGETVYYLIVSIDRTKLLTLIGLNSDSQEIIHFFSALNKPLLYQEVITLDMDAILKELSELKDYGNLQKLYYKARIMELFYLFFSRFFERSTHNSLSANKDDIEKILTIEKIVLEDLSVQPNLQNLSTEIGMSGTKMKLLFKKVFGTSIYNYYQHARMIEAASLLKSNRNMPVSEVGYQLGFSNLSHFSSLFKKHIGMNPKEYTMKF